MDLVDDVRNREETLGRAGCSSLNEDLGVLGSCVVL